MRRHLVRSFAPALTAAFTLMALMTALSATAAAQDENKITNEEHGVELQKPKGWEENSGNEKAVAVFIEPKSQSQIEIVPTRLMTADVAEVFFGTFHKTLTESTFEKIGETTDKEYGGNKAQETTYRFTHSGVTLKVYVVSFIRDTTAWLVVGYMQDKEESKIKPQFEALINGMVFKQQ